MYICQCKVNLCEIYEPKHNSCFSIFIWSYIVRRESMLVTFIIWKPRGHVRGRHQCHAILCFGGRFYADLPSLQSHETTQNHHGGSWIVPDHGYVAALVIYYATLENFDPVLYACWWGLCVIGHFAGDSPVTGEFPAQGPVTRNFDAVFDQRLNKWLSR